MPTFPAYQLAICTWVKAVLPHRHVRPGNMHGVAPETPWAMVRVLSSNSIAPPERRTIAGATSAEQVTTTLDRKRATASITLAEGAHHDDADSLSASRTDPAITLLNEGNKIAITSMLGAVHLGSDSDGTTQNRTVIDFEFSYTISRTSASTEAAQEATASGSVT